VKDFTARLFNASRAEWFPAATLFAVLATWGVIAVYIPLPVDGGWYSYSAYALAEGGNAYQNLAREPLSSPVSITAFFPWDTGSSLRTVYAALWLSLAKPSLTSIRVLSLVEYALFIAAAGVLYRSYGASWRRIVPILSLLALDKSILFGALADFRPDIPLGTASIVLLLCLRSEQRKIRVVGGCAFGASASLLHATAPVPIACACIIGMLYWWRKERRISTALIDSALIAVVAAGMFFAKAALFRELLDQPSSTAGAVDIVARIRESWGRGASFLVTKELHRWRAHFLYVNLFQFFAALVSLLVALRTLVLRRVTAGADVMLGILAGAVMLLAGDPHVAEAHVIPLLPFLLLPLAAEVHAESQRVFRGLGVLALGSLVLTAAMDVRNVRRAIADGYSNPRAAKALAEITRINPTAEIAGGTELWPVFPASARVTLLDRTRKLPEFREKHGVPIEAVDFIIVGPDQRGYGWALLTAELVEKGVAREVWSASNQLSVVQLLHPKARH
jgi:hypothetical protein